MNAWFLLAALLPAQALPTDGVLVWVQGEPGRPETRRVFRMSLAEPTDVTPLTSGEDVEAQISPDGQWVAYAKAKLPGGTDYHDFGLWSLYLVPLAGGDEVLVDRDGYWPSWGAGNTLYYSQTDDAGSLDRHTRIMRVRLNDDGSILEQGPHFATRPAFGPGGADELAELTKIEECFVSPDGSWFAARTRGSSVFEEFGVNAYSTEPPAHVRVGWTERRHGCQPYVAASGTWVYHAGETEGVRWGDAPGLPNRAINQTLAAPLFPNGISYFPHVSNDENWLVVGQSEALDIADIDQNGGAWDLYLYPLEGQSTGVPSLLVGGGHNAWPSLWVPPVTEPDPDPTPDPTPDPEPEPTGEVDASPDEPIAPTMVGGCSGSPSSTWTALVLLAFWLTARRRIAGSMPAVSLRLLTRAGKLPAK